jgi:hypothetical protein
VKAGVGDIKKIDLDRSWTDLEEAVFSAILHEFQL